MLVWIIKRFIIIIFNSPAGITTATSATTSTYFVQRQSWRYYGFWHWCWSSSVVTCYYSTIAYLIFRLLRNLYFPSAPWVIPHLFPVLLLRRSSSSRRPHRHLEGHTVRWLLLHSLRVQSPAAWAAHTCTFSMDRPIVHFRDEWWIVLTSIATRMSCALCS